MTGGIPQISVIVPVYNAARTLGRCVDSLLAQTFADFELLLVDDGSRDESGPICDRYEGIDSRVRVFHKPNGGVSSARNLGLDQARGKYICFVDADDWADNDYLESLFACPVEDRGFVLADLYVESPAGSQPKFGYPDAFFQGEALREFFAAVEVPRSGYPFAKVYVRDMIEAHGLRFDGDVHICEDLLFLCAYLQYAESVRVISRPTYHYVIGIAGSLSTRINSYASERKGLESMKRADEALRNRFALPADYFIIRRGHMLFRTLRALYLEKPPVPREERLGRLRELDTRDNLADLKFYKALLRPPVQVLISLFLRGCHRTFDAAMSFICTLCNLLIK